MKVYTSDSGRIIIDGEGAHINNLHIDRLANVQVQGFFVGDFPVFFFQKIVRRIKSLFKIPYIKTPITIYR